jgi:hypothetical protein
MCDYEKFKNTIYEFQIFIYYIKSTELYKTDSFINNIINGYEIDLKIINGLLKNEHSLPYLLYDERYIILLKKIFKFLKNYAEDNNIVINYADHKTNYFLKHI